VEYLQAIVVFSGTCSGAAFVVPAWMATFWRRGTAAGVMAAMLTGAATIFTLYGLGWLGYAQTIGEQTQFRPYYLLELHPIVWGLGASLVAGLGVSLATKPPEPDRIALCFDALPRRGDVAADGS
jgi:Na+/proline symporter